MPSYTYSIEDYSPLISYSSEWTQGTSLSDPFADRYSQASFQFTNNAGATARFSFNGTGVQIYGARRGNHGMYQVQVDDTVNSPVNGQDSAGSYQVILFEVHNLPLGKHDVTVSNLDAGKYLDIDFVTIDGVVGGTGSGKYYVNAVQDSEPSFSYLPSQDAWSTTPNNIGMFSGSSGHVTSNSGTSVLYTFTGDCVSLYGPLSSDGSPYSVTLDGKTALNSTTIRDRYWPQALLYQGMNLGQGEHKLQVFPQSTASGQTFAVDYADVYTTSESGASQSNALSAGAAAGITAAACIIVVLIGAIIFLLFRRRPRPAARKQPLERTDNTPFIHYPEDSKSSHAPLTQYNIRSELSNSGKPVHTAASSPELSALYLSPMQSTESTNSHGYNYSELISMKATPTRMEWRRTAGDEEGGQMISPVVDPVPRRENPGGPRQWIEPNGYQK